jgi:ABC-type antimicrobial peptide transport system permease subunit
MLQDLRLALRQMCRSPGFAVAGLLISLLAGLVFGMIPLRQIFKTDPNDAIKSGAQSSGGRRWALRDVLLAAQVALCCVTVTAAFVSLRGLGKALTMNMGFNPNHAVITKFVRDLDLSVPIRESSPWKNQLGLTFFVSQVATVALGIFGAFGLLLSIAGTFGLASYTVSKRLRELSIRVALGAQAKEILEAALGRMLILLTAGSAVVLVMGAAASRLLSAIVYQASAQDPFVLVAVAFTMLLTGCLSVASPVRRALHIDPANVLREQ